MAGLLRNCAGKSGLHEEVKEAAEKRAVNRVNIKYCSGAEGRSVPVDQDFYFESHQDHEMTRTKVRRRGRLVMMRIQKVVSAVTTSPLPSAERFHRNEQTSCVMVIVRDPPRILPPKSLQSTAIDC